MPAVRDFFGSNCPHCSKDILQQEPSSNRMPGADRAWCPTCHTSFTLEQLARGKSGAGGFMKRLFGGGRPHSG